MPYKLNYASLQNDGDVRLKEFKKAIERRSFMLDAVFNGKPIVYLLLIQPDTVHEKYLHQVEKIYVFQIWADIANIVDDPAYNSRWNTFHLHEYESYESAYEVALSMRETNPLCYTSAGTY